MTSGELMDALDVVDPNDVRPSLTALKKRGAIHVVAQRLCRVRGTTMQVWVVARQVHAPPAPEPTRRAVPTDAAGDPLLFDLAPPAPPVAPAALVAWWPGPADGQRNLDVAEPAATACESCPTKPRRRSRAQVDAIRAAIVELLEAEHPMTVRQVFYQLVSRAVIAKTEAQYKSTVCRLLAEMRRAGAVPFDWIADSTRWMRKPRTFSSLDDALHQMAETYRRAVWDDQAVYVEIWLEKEALAGVLADVTARWDVPLMVARGYPSLSFVHDAATVIADVGKPAYLYYFGDRDPSGVDIDRKIEEQLRAFAPAADLHLERVAVRPEQIEAYRLPTRPTKSSDSRARHFSGQSVELDALSTAELRRLAEQCITRHVDRGALDRLLRIEQAERETLHELIGKMGQAAGQTTVRAGKEGNSQA